jgi:6-phosphogluconolactonase
LIRPAIEVLPDAAALAEAAAERFTATARDAIQARGEFVVALSGGSTPRWTYERLAAEPLVSRVKWSRVRVVWADERCVPPDQAESNYRMACETLLDHVPVPAENVHRIRGEENPTAAAVLYEATLRALLNTPRTRIDLVLLGLGDDGHTASLFPGGAPVQEQTRWVMVASAPAAPRWRVTLTPPLINAAAGVLFIVSGGTKASAVHRVLEGPRRPLDLPAQAIGPSNGRVRWCLDAAAAAELEDSPWERP